MLSPLAAVSGRPPGIHFTGVRIGNGEARSTPFDSRAFWLQHRDPGPQRVRPGTAEPVLSRLVGSSHQGTRAKYPPTLPRKDGWCQRDADTSMLPVLRRLQAFRRSGDLNQEARNGRLKICPNSQSSPMRHRDPEQVVGKNILIGINCDGLYRRILSGAASGATWVKTFWSPATVTVVTGDCSHT